MLDSLSLYEMIAFATVVFISTYFLGTFLHEIVGAEGFGIVGNAVVLTGGVFLGLYISAEYGIPQRDYPLLAMCGVAGAFGTLVTLIITKMGLRRLGL